MAGEVFNRLFDERYAVNLGRVYFAGDTSREEMEHQLDRMRRPWDYPDRPRFVHPEPPYSRFVLFPRSTALIRLARHMPWRLKAAWRVIRTGEDGY